MAAGLAVGCAAWLAIRLAVPAASADEPDGAPYRIDERRSGYTYLDPENRQLQRDSFANPGMLWVDRGERLWKRRGEDGTSCEGCHGDAEASMRGVAARMPRWDAERGRLENLEMQINQCRTERMDREPWEWESERLLAMTTFIAHQSRGMPMDVRVDGAAAPAFERGQRIWQRRRGQLDLACAHCHDRHAGQRLRGDVISQGMVNGFPIYRLTWETLGSRHRMFRWCNEAVRAEPFAYGSDAFLALELYTAWRSRGLRVETPAVRR